MAVNKAVIKYKDPRWDRSLRIVLEDFKKTINNIIDEVGTASSQDYKVKVGIVGTPDYLDASHFSRSIANHIVITDSGIDHDATTNFVANEHIDWTSTSSNLSTSGTVTTSKLIYSGTPTQGIANGLIEIGDYSTPLSIASPTDHVLAIQCNLQIEGSVNKWYSPAYFKVMTDGSTAATSSHLAAQLLRVTADQACADAYGIQSHVTVANADVSSFVKAGSFKVDRGSGGTSISGEVSALQAILDGSATQGVGRANAFMAVVYSSVTDANEIGYFTANSSSTVANGIYITNHGTMTNAIQVNSAGGTLVNGIDMLGTFSGYGLDLGSTTCSTADFKYSSGNAVKYDSAAPVSGTWIQGDVVYNTGVTAGGKVGWVCTTGGTPGTWKTFGDVTV